VLVGFWVGGAFQSLAYLDEEWCLLGTFEAARGVVAKEIIPAAPFIPATLLRAPPLGIGATAFRGPVHIRPK
jgi:hypothetical protein